MERQDSVQRFLELIRRSHRGKFKVYIGMSAGVGKTWDIKGADGMKIGIFTNLIWNPALDDVNFVGGFSFRM